mmetsp:Transcript_11577/g.36707  ORF Transcript_11577/g.36707 Transcript_11577/m.36707 type:complete len:343 (+) Transcript_11577:199-1227(+)
MSAKGLVEADYFPRAGKYRYPDSWVKISTFLEENERIGLSPKFVAHALAHGDEATRQKLYRATEEHTAVMTTQMEKDIISNLENEDEVAEAHNDRPGKVPTYECATHVVSNSLEPNWSSCCDITEAEGKALLLELFDEDSFYFVNDYMGANLMTDLEEGQYQLPILGGIAGHTDAVAPRSARRPEEGTAAFLSTRPHGRGRLLQRAGHHVQARADRAHRRELLGRVRRQGRPLPRLLRRARRLLQGAVRRRGPRARAGLPRPRHGPGLALMRLRGHDHAWRSPGSLHRAAPVLLAAARGPGDQPAAPRLRVGLPPRHSRRRGSSPPPGARGRRRVALRGAAF